VTNPPHPEAPLAEHPLSATPSAERTEDTQAENTSAENTVAEGGVPAEDDVLSEDDVPAGGGVPADDGVLGAEEDYLPAGQTGVPVGDEVVVDDDTMRRALEAILMVTDEPLPVLTLARAVGRPTGDVAAALAELAGEYTEQGRGFDLREVGGGWRYYTRVEAAPYVERFVLDGQQARLTQAALETLAVVAYKQPVSRARVSAIRGVNVDGVMRTLVARGLVEEAGSDTESQAILYRTTTYFLERMGMQSLDDLPELAPYLPDMDDIEDELAAQSLPPAPPPDPDSTDADSNESGTPPTADSDAGSSTTPIAEADAAHHDRAEGESTSGVPPEGDPSEGESGGTPAGGGELEEAVVSEGDEAPEDEPAAAPEYESADARENGSVDASEDGSTAAPEGDEQDADGTDVGIDGDLRADESDGLDVEHEPDELEPSEEFEPAMGGDSDVSGLTADPGEAAAAAGESADVPEGDARRADAAGGSAGMAEGDAGDAAGTGIDGDLRTGESEESAELDVEHEAGELEPSEEFKPGSAGGRVEGVRDGG